MDAASPPSPTGVDQPPRLILLHYHLFKNAGTSVDAMLRANFGANFVEQEFPGPALRTNRDAVRDFLAARPEVSALSSHSAKLPVPNLAGATVFPILFLRHPLLRLRSAYRFERAQGADTLGSRLAGAHDFPGYIRGLLATASDRQARDFQTLRLALGSPGNAPEANRALRTFNALPFVGLVEAYTRSIRRLGELLAPILPGFRPLVVRANASATSPSSLPDRLRAIEAELGPDLHAELIAANTGDLLLYRRARQLYRADRDPSA